MCLYNGPKGSMSLWKGETVKNGKCFRECVYGLYKGMLMSVYMRGVCVYALAVRYTSLQGTKG